MKLASLIQAARNDHTNTDDRAVSPVIGVILMVAVTVILSAVVGSMALGLGGSIQQIAPNANFQFEYTANASNPGNYDVTATHMGGDVITAQETSSLSLIGGGDAESFALSVGAGDSATLGDVSNATAVRVIWTSADGESSQTLASGRTPE